MHLQEEKGTDSAFFHLPFRLYLFRQNCLLCSRHRFRSCDLWVMGPARFLCASLLRAELENYNRNLRNKFASKMRCRPLVTLYNIRWLNIRYGSRAAVKIRAESPTTSVHFYFRQNVSWLNSWVCHGLVAQGLEHCSSKAGVESSNLSEAFC